MNNLSINKSFLTMSPTIDIPIFILLDTIVKYKV